PDLGAGRVLHSAVALPDGRVLVTGGEAADGSATGAELLDAAARRWEPAAAAPAPRMAAAAVVLPGGAVMVSGGVGRDGLATGAASRALAGTDDYPASLRNAAQDSLVDPWGFYNRECTSFAAWRLARDGHPITNWMRGGHFGNAWHWAANA